MNSKETDYYFFHVIGKSFHLKKTTTNGREYTEYEQNSKLRLQKLPAERQIYSLSKSNEHVAAEIVFILLNLFY